MNKIFKRIGAFFCALTMIVSLNISTFAANRYFNKGCLHNNTQFSHTVSFTKWGTDTVTIVNTGGAPIEVNTRGFGHKKLSNGTKISIATIKPGSEMSFAYSGNGPYSIWFTNKAKNTVSYRIKTTSGKIS